MYAPPIIFREKRPVKKLSRLDRDPLQLPPPARDSMSSKNDTRKEKETTTTYYLRPKDGSKAVTTVKDKPTATAPASVPVASMGTGKLGSKNVQDAPTSMIESTPLIEGYFKKGGKTKKRRRKKRKKRKTKKKRRRKKKTRKKRGRRKKRTRRR